MVDVLTSAQRQLVMGRIKGKNTQPEIKIRSALHLKGLRFRLHQKNLPGRPDLVFQKYKCIVFIHGCFWHKHDCHLFQQPATRKEFWKKKIDQNQLRDQEVLTSLRKSGWRIAVVWECALRGRSKLEFETLINSLASYIRNNSENELYEIRGKAL